MGPDKNELGVTAVPLRPTLSPWWCGGLPLGQQPEHGQLELRAGRAGKKTSLDWRSHGLDSTTT